MRKPISEMSMSEKEEEIRNYDQEKVELDAACDREVERIRAIGVKLRAATSRREAEELAYSVRNNMADVETLRKNRGWNNSNL